MAFYSPYQFALFRLLLGAYLAFVLIGYLVNAPDLFLPAAFLGSGDAGTQQFVAFHVLRFFHSGFQVQLYLGFLAVLSGCLSLGLARRWVAFVLWFGWIGLFFTQGRVAELHIFFVEWLLFVCVVAPSGEGWAFYRRPIASWRLSGLLFWGSWFILALGLFMLGVGRLSDPSWRSGSALLLALDSPYARDWFLVWGIKILPEIVLRGAAWIEAGFFVAFPFLCLWPPSRRWAWTILVCFLILSLLVFSTGVETLGFLLLAAFVFDRRWGCPDGAVEPGWIVFYDEHRVQGRVWADFLCAEDITGSLRFAPLTGKTAVKHLDEGETQPSTVLAFRQDARHSDAEAITTLIPILGGPWRLGASLKWFPPRMRAFCFRLMTGWMRLYGGKQVTSKADPEKRRCFLN